MNLPREKAIEAMDVLTANGYTVQLDAVVIRNEPATLYRIALPTLHFDAVDLRALCDLAEAIGLECRFALQAIRFEPSRRRRP